MKKEVELKFFVKNHDAVRQRLKKIRAAFLWRGKETNSYFDTPQFNLRARGIALRVRNNAKGARITCKENVSKKKFKIANEWEVSVSDFKETAAMFQKIGLIKILSYTRSREYWRYAGADITLDSTPVGKFVEIETSGARIKKIARVLGLQLEKTTTKSYIQLLRERTNGKKPR